MVKSLSSLLPVVCRCSHATHDLYNSIAAEDYPEWDFKIQTMDPTDQLNFDFDPLDCTKVCAEPQMRIQAGDEPRLSGTCSACVCAISA